jgi:hypothetical protein
MVGMKGKGKLAPDATAASSDDVQTVESWFWWVGWLKEDSIGELWLDADDVPKGSSIEDCVRAADARGRELGLETEVQITPAGFNINIKKTEGGVAIIHISRSLLPVEQKIFEYRIVGSDVIVRLVPPSQPADTTQQPGMRNGFEIAAKEAKAERTAAAQVVTRLANYQFLARTVDLENPKLAADERLRRARRLLTAYERLLRAKPDLKDSNAQLTAARRIKQAAHRAMRPGPAVRGRPPKAAHR